MLYFNAHNFAEVYVLNAHCQKFHVGAMRKSTFNKITEMFVSLYFLLCSTSLWFISSHLIHSHPSTINSRPAAIHPFNHKNLALTVNFP